jgi:hypothetical protein
MKKIFFIIFIVFFNTNVFSKSILPECKGSKIKEYNNCYKTGKYSNGDTREGEMMDGKYNGGAFFVTKDKEQYREVWKDGDLISRNIIKKNSELNRFQKILKAIGL